MRRRCVALLGLAAALSACGPDRVAPPLGVPPRLASAGEREGQVSFMRHCHQCHPGGAAGLGPALNNKPLPGPLVAFQIRHGIGAMPAFPEAVLPDGEVDRIVAYVAALRRAV